jgi:glutamate/tyrosine decarboxylase-like PLP-dependent enzyme
VDKIKIIATLKWVYDLLREDGHYEALDDVEDCIVQLRMDKWVGLTDDERNEMIGRIQHDQYTRQRDLINSTQIITEMYLKEKNGAI